MADYRADAEAALRDGFTFLLHLTAVDELGRDGGFRVVLMLERPTDHARVTVEALVPRDEPVAPGVEDLWAGAAWLQRHVHESFGVRFVRPDGTACDDAPLIVHGEDRPLRKEFLLEPRSASSWPGALEPGQSAPSGRKLLPVGVPDPAVVDNPAATESDIALSATGTRVRLRR